MEFKATTFAAGFAFPEGPRWREGKLWFSDMLLSKVFCLSGDGTILESFPVPGQPSGLGWRPNGELIVVSMKECRLYLRKGDRLSPVADLRPYHRALSNDMVVDQHGRAYIGAIGYDFESGEEYRSTSLVVVSPAGESYCAAEDIDFPNGLAVTGDGKKLIVAETVRRRLSAFDIDDEGGLSNYRIFADLGGYSPDGICMDSEGAVWVATTTPEVIRVEEGGAITDRVRVQDANTYACMLGGKDGRDLFICCAPNYDPVGGPEQLSGRVDLARVTFSHAGLP